jgi:hypothetical protein
LTSAGHLAVAHAKQEARRHGEPALHLQRATVLKPEQR